MTPEERIEKLERIVNGLLDASQADPNMVTTLGLLMFKAGSKGADSEDVSIDEAGAATKVVLNDPDGFTEGADGNFYAYWTS